MIIKQSLRKDLIFNRNINRFQSIQRSQFSYNFNKIDSKWQSIWKQQSEEKKTEMKDEKQEKMYILGQFPYPSGNIHMGHVRVYTICDVLTRYYKQKNINVINPMGWDSFGLPAENAAIQRKVNPAKWTAQNITEMKDQLNRMGFQFDWDKELATHSPEYYKHTQKIFIELFNRGLAYKKDAQVNWDPIDNTVLANEQIDANGCSWRSGAKVEKKMLSQWFLNIRKYADEILENLDNLAQWNEVVKDLQRGWIGKSIGSNVVFDLKLSNGSTLPLTIFTTRLETIFGATFVAISHEHPIIKQLLTEDNWIDANAYERYLQSLEILQGQGKNLKEIDLENMEPGLQLQNIKAIHPFTKQEIPVFLASYVLNEYGTGSIMGVPMHDERDCAFSLNNGIDMIQVIDGDEENAPDQCKLGNSQQYTGMKLDEARLKMMEDLKKVGRGNEKIEYRLKDWLVSRQRYWGVPIPIVFCDTCGQVPVKDEDLPVFLPDVDNYGELLSKGRPLSHIDHFVNCKCPKCGGAAKREVDTLDTFVDSSWYFLRFLDSQNKNQMFDVNKLKEWMPVDIYVGGMEHAIMHLLYARFIHKFMCDINNINHDGKKFNILREPFKELIVQGLVKGKTYKLKSNGKYLFTDEAQQYKENEIEVCFEKMSKSKGNGVSPDSMAEKYGVDTLRLALMFGGPPQNDLNFDENFLQNMKQFLDKVTKLGESFSTKNDSKIIRDKSLIQNDFKEQMIPIYQLLLDYKLKINVQRFFHVAIARLMELNNLLIKMNGEALMLGYCYLIQALYPFIPHLASEIWEELELRNQIVTKLGFEKDLSIQRWDNIEELLSKSQQNIQIKVSLDGQFIGTISVPKSFQGQPDKIFEEIKNQQPKDMKKLKELLARQNASEFVKSITFPDKPIINFITK